MTRIKAGDWVVVCDGRKALILRNAGDHVFLNLRLEESHEDFDLSTIEQGGGGGGRVHESTAMGRRSLAHADWHDQNEREFLHGLARRLDRALAGGEVSAIIIIAAPRALGMLREAYSPALRKAVKREIAKDYVNKPVYGIEQQLGFAIA
jgi:protein required for attachment to host cells